MENNQELYNRINRLIGHNTIDLPAESIVADVDKINPIYLPKIHQLLEPHEIVKGKLYYAIDIKNKENVMEGQVETQDGKFYSSGPFQNLGKLKKIENIPGYGYSYYFDYGKTTDDFDPNKTYGSEHPHYYLYLDQDTINKPLETPLEIPPENVFKITDTAKNIPFYKTTVTHIAGKKRKTKKSRKSRKHKKKTRKNRSTRKLHRH